MNRLADEVRVVRDVLNEVREDLGWVTRNGIPGHRGEHTQIVRMARDPLSPDANERLETQRSSADESGSPSAFDELVSEITEAVTVVGQEQVDLLLTALDDVRAKLLAAIKAPQARSNADKAIAAPQSSVLPNDIASLNPSERGRLF